MKKILASFFILLFFVASAAAASLIPNDTYYNNQWYLGKIKADSAWSKISASPDISIAVIDGGVQIYHRDLRDNIWRSSREIASNGIDDDHNGFIDDVNGWDFVNNVPDPAPKFMSGWTEAGVSHGTMVTGVIAARGNNREGITGLTWAAKIMPLKALNDKGEGRTSDVVRAIDYAINNGADIINLSFVSLNYNASLQEAITRAYQAGVIVVAAAGNEQSGGEGYNTDKTPIYPACYDGSAGENMVIGVAATDALDQKTKFSSYGARCVDLVAPGISFFSTISAGSVKNDPNRIYDGYWSGTSMAAPLVSATLALIEQADPALSPKEAVNILLASTDNVSRLNPAYLGQLGLGRLNVNRAIEMTKEKLYRQVGHLIIIPARGNKEAKLTVANGDLVNNLSSSNFKSGSNPVAGDVNNDGTEEFVIGAGAGSEPQIKILDVNGKLLEQFLAFDKKFRGGVTLALGDLDGNGSQEIIAAQASLGTGQIRVFDNHGKLKKQFLVDNKYWRGGLNLAAGDLEGSGRASIVVGYGAGKEPLVKIFKSDGRLLSSFYAYEKKFRGGVRLALANLYGRKAHNRLNIIVAPGPGREPLLKIFDYSSLKKEFLVYGENWQGGVSLAAGDLNNDGIAEIALGALPGAAPHVRVFSGQGDLLESFYTWEEGFNGGVNVGIIEINN